MTTNEKLQEFNNNHPLPNGSPPSFVEDVDVVDFSVLHKTAADCRPGDTEGGRKADHGKDSWSLLPMSAVREVVTVLTIGAKKYDRHNWKHVPGAAGTEGRYIDAAYRHMGWWMEGESLDKETGKHHLAHAICCLLFALWFEQHPEAERK